MKSYEWNTAKQTFVEVDDPTYDEGSSTVSEAILAAGYFAEFSSAEEGDTGAMFTVYATQDENKPRFYIDIMGLNTGIATLVARDFISLVETLNKIQPLLTLAGLDQFHSARVADQVAREKAERKAR